MPSARCSTAPSARFFDAGLTPEEVLDLVPVKPLAEREGQILQAYREVLPALHAKLTGA